MSLLRFLLMSLILLSTTLWAGVGKVALLKGEATLERGVQKTALQNGTALEEKDIIKTSKDAQVQLMFEDKTVITLGSESEFKIEEYLNDNANPKAKFKFNQGAFKTITGQIGKTAPENFTLETKTATIGIRGTIIAGNVPPPPPPNIPPLPEAIFCLGGTITVAPITMPTIVVVVPTGSFTQVTPSAPPSPPAIFTPADLQQLNQNLGGTPPPPPSSNTPPPSSNTPPTGNSEGQNNNPPPPPAASPTPQTFTPTAAAGALQTNSQALVQNIVIQNVAQELNVSLDTIKDQIKNQICPSGTAGVFPNCVAMTCPENTAGVYPDCIALTCPTGTTGTYPNCTVLTCPSGTTGTYPNCVAQTCPSGTTGTYPNCTTLTCPSGTTGTYPNCVALTCPSGYVGNYPNCNLPQGGGNDGSTSTTKTVYVMAASDVINGEYFYESGRNITLSSNYEVYSSIPFQGYYANGLPESNNTSSTSYSLPLSYLSHFVMTYVTNPDKVAIYGEKTTNSLPTTGISTYIEPSALGNTATRVNFANKNFLAIDLNEGTSIIMGKLPASGSSFEGFFYDFGLAFADKSEGNVTGQFFGQPSSGYGPVGIGLVGVGEDFDNNGSDFISSGYSVGALGGFLNHDKSKTTANIIGDMSINGFGVTRYDGNNTSTSDTMTLTMTRDEGRSIGSSEMILSNSRGSYTLTQSDTNKSTYVTDDYFAIVGFNAQESWLVGIPTGIAFAENSHVSWGMWGVNESNASKMYPSTNYWVAGENMSTAAAHISSILNPDTPPSYVYNGKILGRVYDGVSNHYRIDPYNDTSNTIHLKFDFGSGIAIDNSSYMRFTVNNNLWYMSVIDAGPIANAFSGALSGNDINGTLQGAFFGTTANSIGGTFQAKNNSNTDNYAIGVFVADKRLLSLKGFATSISLIPGEVDEIIREDKRANDLSLDLYHNQTNGIIGLYGGDFPFSLNGGKLTYTDEQNFRIENFGGYEGTSLETITPLNEYTSWGKWTSVDANTTTLATPHNFWIVGKEDDALNAINHINTTRAGADYPNFYSYSGNILGMMYDGSTNHAITPISDTTNKVLLTFDFGNGNAFVASKSFMRFTPAGTSELWNMEFYGDDPLNTVYLDGILNIDFWSHDGGITGQFYGSNAEALGGSFNATNDNNHTAYGVFTASKTNYALMGLTTSAYDDNGIEHDISNSLILDATTPSKVAGNIFLNHNGENYFVDQTSLTFVDYNTSDYVSWGYWTATEIDGNTTLMAGTHSWVAGKDAAAAAAYVQSLTVDLNTTSYTYTGKVLGKVVEGVNNHSIDTATSSVILNFDFGGGQNSLKNTSSITFSATGATVSSWNLTPTAAPVTNGKFDTTLSGADSGYMKGQFFGNQAQAVGGTLKALSGSSTAIGVFKAVRP